MVAIILSILVMNLATDAMLSLGNLAGVISVPFGWQGTPSKFIIYHIYTFILIFSKFPFLSSFRLDRHVALKVVKSAPRYTETALDEIKLLQRIISGSAPPNSPHAGRRHVIGFLDHFRHKGPNGNHVCMVFEVLGESLLGLIKRYQVK